MKDDKKREVFRLCGAVIAGWVLACIYAVSVIARVLPIVLLLLLASTAQAQTAADCTGPPTTAMVVVDATPILDFTKSTDHDAVIAGTTTPVLASYAVAICTGTSLTSQANIGKPTPDAAGKVSVALPNAALLAKNVPYYVVIYAVASGTLGSNKSGPTAPFVMAGLPAAVAPASVVVRP